LIGCLIWYLTSSPLAWHHRQQRMRKRVRKVWLSSNDMLRCCHPIR
jgi:hypothetical protein